MTTLDANTHVTVYDAIKYITEHIPQAQDIENLKTVINTTPYIRNIADTLCKTQKRQSPYQSLDRVEISVRKFRSIMNKINQSNYEKLKLQFKDLIIPGILPRLFDVVWSETLVHSHIPDIMARVIHDIYDTDEAPSDAFSIEVDNLVCIYNQDDYDEFCKQNSNQRLICNQLDTLCEYAKLCNAVDKYHLCHMYADDIFNVVKTADNNDTKFKCILALEAIHKHEPCIVEDLAWEEVCSELPFIAKMRLETMNIAC